MIYDGENIHAYEKNLQKTDIQFRKVPNVKKLSKLVHILFFLVFTPAVACSFVSIADETSYGSAVTIKCYGQIIYPDSLNSSLPQSSPPQSSPFSWFNTIWTLIVLLSHVCTIISCILAMKTYQRLKKSAVRKYLVSSA